MSVSTRNTLLTTLGALVLAGMAWAGGGMGGGSDCNGCSGPKGHGVVIPGAGIGVPVVSPGITQLGGAGCNGCGLPKGHSVTIPGVNIAGPNVTVGAPNISVNQAGVAFGTTSFVETGLAVQGRDDRTFLSTGGAYHQGSGVATSALNSLNVAGVEETYTDYVTEEVPTTQTTCVAQSGQTSAWRPVQAVCVDDKGTPHPASRPSAEERVNPDFEGEIFRCMAGTTMQVILGDRELSGGHAGFKNASGFSCAKGEALVHRRGGQLVCAAQKPRRNCNERSLLRRNGPGIKLVHASRQNACVPTTTTVMQTVTRHVERTRPAKTGPIVFDGGVGQSVF